MMMQTKSTIKDYSREDWSALEQPDFPFTDFEFLHALETSGSIGEGTGWYPQYQVWQSPGKLDAVGLSFVKTNSYGEYIFDWQWAEAYKRYQIPYYPKQTSAIPFTPATGSKLLRRSGSAVSQLDMITAMTSGQPDVSGFHALFIPEREVELYESAGYSKRLSFQFHWKNDGYDNFEQFLKNLKGKKHKAIAKERREVAQHDLNIRTLTHEQLTPEIADAVYGFYRMTCQKMRAIPYLQRGFFEEIFSSMKDRIALPCAFKGSKPIAAALNFYKGQSFFGRYWGCSEEYKHLHFELCYYRTLDFVIDHKINLMEAGAQGHHKLQRGFVPCLTHSAHRILYPEFKQAIDLFIQEEADHLRTQLKDPEAFSPFKPKPL